MKTRRMVFIIKSVCMFLISIILIIVSNEEKKEYKYQNVKLEDVIVYTCWDSELEDATLYLFRDKDLYVLNGTMLLDQSNYRMSIYDNGNINLQIDDQQKILITDQQKLTIEKEAEEIINNKKYDESLAEGWTFYDGRYYGIYIDGVEYFVRKNDEIEELVDFIIDLSEK